MQQQDIQEFKRRLEYYCRSRLKGEQPPHGDHQIEAHEAVLKNLDSMRAPKDWWSLMVMATGSGKSFTAGKEIKAFNTQVGARQPTWDYPALIVTSRLLLTEQFKKDLAEKVGIPESDIGVYSGKSRNPSQLCKPVLIVPYPSFTRLSGSGVISPEKRPILVLDEAHNATAPQAMEEIRRNWVGKSYVQCWTATDKLPHKTVAQVLFNQNTGRDVDDAAHRLTLKQAAERGITAPLKSMVLQTEFVSGAKPNAKGEFTQKDEERIVNQQGRKEALIRLCRGDYRDEFGVDFCGMKTIVFVPSIAHGKEMEEEFNRIFGPGYAVAVSGTGTNPKEMDVSREGSIAWRFTRGDRAKGDPRIILNAKLLEEGVDLPAAELCVEEIPTFSERVETQRVGRVTRKLNGKTAYSVVMMDRDQTGAAVIGEMEGWALKPGDFEFPKPAPEKSGLHPPLPPDYPEIPVHVIATPQEIAEFREGRASKQFRNKPKEGYLRAEEFGKLIQKANPKITNPEATGSTVMGDIRKQLDRQPIAYYKSISILPDAIDQYGSIDKPAYALREAECRNIAAQYGIIKEQPKKGYLRSEEFGKLIHQANPKFTEKPVSTGQSIITNIRKQLDHHPLAYYKTVPISPEAIDEYEYKGKMCHTLREAECRSIAAQYAMIKDQPKKGFLRGEELGELVQAANPKIKNSIAVGHHIISDIRDQLKHQSIAYYKDVPILPEAFDEYEYNGKFANALRAAECHAIASKYAAVKNYPKEGYLRSAELGALVQAANPNITDAVVNTGNNIIGRIRKQLKRQPIAYYRTVPIPQEAVDEYDNTGKPAYALRETESHAIAAQYQNIRTQPKAGYLRCAEFGELLKEANPKIKFSGAIASSTVSKIRAQLKDQPIAYYRTVPILPEAIDEYEYSGGLVYALREAECHAIAAQYAAEYRQENATPDTRVPNPDATPNNKSKKRGEGSQESPPL